MTTTTNEEVPPAEVAEGLAAVILAHPETFNTKENLASFLSGALDEQTRESKRIGWREGVAVVVGNSTWREEILKVIYAQNPYEREVSDADHQD